MSTGPDTTRKEILRTNRLLHDRDAGKYDARHHYVSNRRLGAQVNEDIRAMRNALRIQVPFFLDLGAGTGFLSHAFLHHGYAVTAVDISHNMLTILKTHPGNEHIAAVTSSIDDFLDMVPPGRFHVMGFSSTLHHLPDYMTTLDACCKLLPPGGFLYIINEPPKRRNRSVIGDCLDTLDEVIDGFVYKTMHDRGDLWGSFVRRLTIICKKLLNRHPDRERFLWLFRADRVRERIDRIQFRFQKNAGNEFIDDTIAEFHAGTGLDTDRMKQLFAQHSCTIIEESVYSTKRFLIFRWLEHIFPGDRHCRLIVRNTLTTGDQGNNG